MKLYGLIAAAAMLTPSAVAAESLSQPQDYDAVKSTQLIVYSADLRDADATAALDKRIAKAADQVCPERDVRNVKMQLKARACLREAKAGAAAQVARLQQSRAGQ